MAVASRWQWSHSVRKKINIVLPESSRAEMIRWFSNTNLTSGSSFTASGVSPAGFLVSVFEHCIWLNAATTRMALRSNRIECIAFTDSLGQKPGILQY
jgi:hypothetical protein